MVLPCDENVPPSFVYLTVTKVVSVFIVDHTVILSDGINLFLITLDKHFSKIVKQVMTPLKGNNNYNLILDTYSIAHKQ